MDPLQSLLEGVAPRQRAGGGVLDTALRLEPYVGNTVSSILVAPVFGIARTLLYYDLGVQGDTTSVYSPEMLATELDKEQD